MNSICIVAHNAFGFLTGTKGHIGGIELQTALLARYLSERGVAVNFVTWDEAPRDAKPGNGIRLLRLCRSDAGVPGLRFFHPRWTSLLAALRKADADIYYHNGAEYVTGQVARFCRRHGKAFVFSAANDHDCDPALPGLPTLRERLLYRYGLKQADGIVVQTENQQRSLLGGFDQHAIVLPMPCEIRTSRQRPFDAGVRRVLWAGRIVPVKRLELFLDIAERVPGLEYHIAGGPDGDGDYAQGLIARAETLSNVTYHGPLARDKVAALFDACDLLACTSTSEGFPNTFLEAWGHGMPVVSTFDPDGLIDRQGLGRSVTDVESLVTALQDYRGNADIVRECSARCCDYFNRTHAHDLALGRFADFFEQVLCDRRR